MQLSGTTQGKGYHSKRQGQSGPTETKETEIIDDNISLLSNKWFGRVA